MSESAYSGQCDDCQKPPDPLIGIAIVYDKSCGFPPYVGPPDPPNSFLGGYFSKVSGFAKTSVATYVPAASSMLYTTRNTIVSDDPADCAGFGPPPPAPGTVTITEQYDASCVYSSTPTGSNPCGGDGAETNEVIDQVARSFQITHQPPITCYLKCWLRGVITASSGGGTVELDPYIFNPGGNCIPDPPQPVYSNGPSDPALVANPANTITSAPVVINDDTNPAGTTWEAVEIYKWSIWPTYEPPDDGSANGCPAGVRETP